MIKKYLHEYKGKLGLTLNQKTILSNVNWLLGAYVYRFVTGMVALAFVTRYLGPEKYGIYAYSLSFFSFVEVSLNLINQEIFKKEVLESKDQQKITNTYFYFMFLCSLALVFITCSLLWFFDVEVGERRIIISILSLSLLFRAVDTLSYFLNVKMRNDLISKAELFSTTSFNLTRILLTLAKATLPWFAVTVILQKIVNFIYILRYYLSASTHRIVTKDFDLKLAYSLISKSFPLFIAATSAVVFTRIDQLMIGNLLSNEDVGLYSIVVKLSESWSFMSIILTQSVYPSLIKSYNFSLSDFNHKVQKSLSILFYLALLIILFTILFSEQLITIISSDDYLDASSVLQVHIVSILFLFWQNLNNQYDIIVGAARFTLIKTIIASILNIVLNYFLITSIGILGASIATIISYATATFILNAFYSKTRPFFYLQTSAFMFWQTKWFS